jgi:hypothetical protein
MSDYQTCTKVPNKGKTGEMSWKIEARRQERQFLMCMSRSPPPALEVTGDLDKEDHRVGKRGNGLGAGLTGFSGGIDEQSREEVIFASLSPPIFGKTEVTRELD